MGNSMCLFPEKYGEPFKPPTPEENEKRRVKTIRVMQFVHVLPMAQLYAFVERTLYGSCIMDADEETKDNFELIMYLGDEKISISNEHAIWDKYNLMAIQHIEELDFPVNALQSMARKVTVLRARILQGSEPDEYSEVDYRLYDYLLDNWSEDITIDILLLHRFKDEPSFRIMETRVLFWMISKMANPPDFLISKL